MVKGLLRSLPWLSAALLVTLPLFAAEPVVQQLPIGTLLPVILNSSLDSGKAKPGEKISAKLKQDVPLPDKGRVKAGSDVYGHVVSVKRGSDSSPATMIIAFDSMKMDGRTYPITTGLRAIASMQAVYQARLPINGAVPDNLSVWDWNTRQIGGEIVFGGQRKVEGKIGTVGTMVEPGWVVGIARGNPEEGCPNPDNKNLQAFWIFSTDACGPYGWNDLKVLRAPDDVAGGNITLAAPKKIEIRSGAALLLEIETQQTAGAGGL